LEKLIVLAIGGNSIIRHTQKGTYSEQANNITSICKEVVIPILKMGYRIVLVFGKGPGIRNMLIQEDAASGRIPRMPFDTLVARLDGQTAYLFGQAIYNLLLENNLKNIKVITIMVQVASDEYEISHTKSFRPIAPLFGEEEVDKLKKEKDWVFIKDSSGRGYHRVLPNLVPKDIIEKEDIKRLLDGYSLIIALGGGGIPVIKKEDGTIYGTEALIDKDLSAACLASSIGAKTLMILTNVEKIAINYGKQSQVDLDTMTLEEAKRYFKEGHFPMKTMGPKIQAAIMFIESGGREAIITKPSCAALSLEGKAGTRVISF
jgi:carbamate kinase